MPSALTALTVLEPVGIQILGIELIQLDDIVPAVDGSFVFIAGLRADHVGVHILFAFLVDKALVFKIFAKAIQVAS